jgi:hypothetical protein
MYLLHYIINKILTKKFSSFKSIHIFDPRLHVIYQPLWIQLTLEREVPTKAESI